MYEFVRNMIGLVATVVVCMAAMYVLNNMDKLAEKLFGI